MAILYKALTELYRETQRKVTAPSEWQAFLAAACRNYRLSFYEQLLVYAQRPDATAVLEIERWNRQFGRWVNRGANGIAVFDGEHTGKPRLKYYFDISDTHEARFPRPVPIWTVREEYAPDIIETLENSFGELEHKEDLGAALLSAAKNAVEDNMPDYLSELKSLTEGSFLEELDGLNLEVEYRGAVQNSIGYMLLVRCGLDPSEYFEDRAGGYARRLADQRHRPGVPPCFQPLERLYRPGAQQRLLPGGFVLLRVCALLYGGREDPLPGILPGAAACEKAGGTGAIIRLNGGMNHGRIGSCPAGTPADY